MTNISVYQQWLFTFYVSRYSGYRCQYHPVPTVPLIRNWIFRAKLNMLNMAVVSCQISWIRGPKWVEYTDASTNHDISTFAAFIVDLELRTHDVAL